MRRMLECIQASRTAWIALFLVSIGIGTFTFSGCTANARYKTLCFFFDEVPSPEEVREREDTETVSALNLRKRVVTRARSFHLPYRNMKCYECHATGKNVPKGKEGLLKVSVEDGLCQSCHKTIPDDVKYIHAPALVNACLECHHHHQASYPKLLLVPGNETCFRCHRKEDLSTGDYHTESLELEDDSESTCVKCHNPHHGRARYFLVSEEAKLKAAEEARKKLPDESGEAVTPTKAKD